MNCPPSDKPCEWLLGRPLFPKLRTGFTLVELLTVIGIIALLTVAAGPAIQSMMRSGNLRQGVYEVAGLLELARSEAVARQTFVWVGFQQENSEGDLKVRFSAVGALDKDGSNTAQSNLFYVSKVLTLKGVSLVEWSTLRSATKDAAAKKIGTAIVPASVATSTSGLSFKVGAKTFSDKTSITFTPRGQAMLVGPVNSESGYDRTIDVSFRQAKGSVPDTNGEEAVVVIDGGTGSIQVVRQE